MQAKTGKEVGGKGRKKQEGAREANVRRLSTARHGP